MFDTHPKSKLVDIHRNLIKQSLVEEEVVMDYITCLKNIQLEIVKCGVDDVEENFMTSILVNLVFHPLTKNY